MILGTEGWDPDYGKPLGDPLGPAVFTPVRGLLCWDTCSRPFRDTCSLSRGAARCWGVLSLRHLDDCVLRAVRVSAGLFLCIVRPSVSAGERSRAPGDADARVQERDEGRVHGEGKNCLPPLLAKRLAGFAVDFAIADREGASGLAQN